jgi:hypothetical protein
MAQPYTMRLRTGYQNTRTVQPEGEPYRWPPKKSFLTLQLASCSREWSMVQVFPFCTLQEPPRTDQRGLWHLAAHSCAPSPQARGVLTTQGGYFTHAPLAACCPVCPLGVHTGPCSNGSAAGSICCHHLGWEAP